MRSSECSKGKRSVILACGLIETFLFSGVIFGWADLILILKTDGVFSDYCNKTDVLDCSDQDNLFDLAFTLAAAFKGGTAIFIALLLDHWGLRFSRIMANIMIVGGGYLISYGKVCHYLIFPGTLLISLGGSQVRMNNFLVANLFPVHKSTVISLYNGAFSASGAVFLFFKCSYQYGAPIETLFALWAGVAGFMLFPTMFLFPADTIEPDDDTDHELHIEASCSKCNTYLQSQYLEDKLTRLLITTDSGWSSTQTSNLSSVAVSDAPHRRSTWSSICSAAFFLHVLWSCVCTLGLTFYAGSFLRLVESLPVRQHTSVVTFGKRANRLVELYGYSQLPMFFIAPLGGAVMDYHLYHARKDFNPKTRHVRARRGGFLCLALTTCFIICLYVCIIFRKVWTLQMSLIFFILSRPLLNAVCVAYLRVRFPAKDFNRLFGVLATITSLFGLVQYPLFVWSGTDYVATYATMIGMCTLVMVKPLHLLLPQVVDTQDHCIIHGMGQDDDEADEHSEIKHVKV